MSPDTFSRPRAALVGGGLATFWTGLLALQTLDVSDPGLHLAKQLAILTYGAEESFGIVWLSDLIGALWLGATRDLGLYWVRWGWVLSVVVPISALCWVLAPLLTRRHLCLAATASAVIVSSRSHLVLSYDTVAPALLALSFVLLGRSVLSPGTLPPVAAGILCFGAVMARLPVAPAAALGLLPWLFGDSGRRTTKLFLGGLALAAAVTLAVLSGLGLIESFLESYRLQLGNIEDVEHAGRFQRTTYRQIPYFGALAVAALAALATTRATTLRGSAGLRAALAGAGWVALAVLLPFPDSDWNRAGVGSLAALSCLAAVQAQALLRRKNWDTPEDQVTLLLLAAGLAMPLLLTLGASSGLGKAVNGASLLPFALLIGGAATGRARASLAVVLAVAVFTLGQTLTAAQREGARHHLFSRTEAPFSRSVLTSPERAALVDDVVRAVAAHAGSGAPMITSGRLPLFVLLTDSTPALRETFVDLSLLSARQRQAAIDDICGRPEPVWLLTTDTHIWLDRPRRAHREQHASIELDVARCFEDPVWESGTLSLRRSRAP